MYHFFVTQDQIGEERITITGSDVNHMKNVLRMKPGERVLISNGRDKDYLCEIEEMTAQKAEVGILSAEETGTELPAKLYLFQGLPKGDKMEVIIQKAVELGVYRVIPVSTQRTVVKLNEKKEEAKCKRWNAIAESAAKQSKRLVIPEVTGVMSIKEAFAYAKEFDMNFIPYEEAKGMEETKREFDRVKPGTQAGIFIGPEGGFADSEIALALENRIRPVTLGRRILRTETAGIAVLSILMYQLES